ncbi:hypothetical protein [Microvirga sp. CF3016]|uniref:hypothetical protein n=1 Tax=Microvirga sp. CF3016 TaxID=3110181 RepID=UPI002E7932A2|nr:hypothetical protein [Microvirga sp. CF3016]MEE1609889.1 hypothetical protein [Microvirga sp. CF3016]
MTLRSLRWLYGDAFPVRGDVDIRLGQDAATGVTGVIAAVAALLTGAAGAGGFKGIAGRFERRDRLSYGADIDGEIQFTRRDTGLAVVASLNAAAVPLHADARSLFQRIVREEVSPGEAREFQRLWQERVRQLLIDHANDTDVILLRRMA